ncbi:MAG TPA: ornithine carbamoyltransferase [Acidimicrobiales bacterium]
MARHLLEIDDLAPAELDSVLDLAERAGPPAVLAGRGVALVFEKPSARTRSSMEMAVVQLGGHPVTIRGDEVGLDTRETTEDVARTLACFHAVIAARVLAHTTLERMVSVLEGEGHSPVPVVNLLSDQGHPVQALADLLTLRQHFGRLEGLTIAFVGDGNNVARSLALGCALSGATFRIASPDGFALPLAEVARVAAIGGAIDTFSSPPEAVAGADAVYTDTWTSMGQEGEAEDRRAAFAGYRVDRALMDRAAKGAVFLHCMPAHRGEEVASEVMDGPRSLIWQQAENRMHAARGLLWWLANRRGR